MKRTLKKSMNSDREELKQKIAELIKEAPEAEHEAVFEGKGTSSVVDTNLDTNTSVDKEASLKGALSMLLKGVVRGSNFLSSVPERLANSAKIQVFGGNELTRLAGPFTAPKALKSMLRKKFGGQLTSKSIFGSGVRGEAFKSATKNIYQRGERVEGAAQLAGNMFSPKQWKGGLNTVFGAKTSIGGKQIKNKGVQRALGFMTNNPMDIALTALDYSSAKSKKEKNEVLAKGIPTFMLSNTLSSLGGKRYSLMSNLMAGAIAHKTINTAWTQGGKLLKKKKKDKTNAI